MKTYENGQSAPYGTYATAFPPDIRFVGADGETLDALPSAKYVRLPTPLVFAITPIVGGVFVLAFPVMVLVATGMALWMLASRLLSRANATVTSRVKETVDRHSYVVRQRWEPVTAYLDGKGDEEEGAGETHSSELEDLEAEVTERRQAERETETPDGQ
jgi:hypothetical protein